MRKLFPFFICILFVSCEPDTPLGALAQDTAEDENTVDTFSVKRPDHSVASDDHNSQSSIDSIIHDASTIINNGKVDTSTKINNSDFIVERPDVAPYFPGGDVAMMAYFKKNLVYPLVAFQNDIKGMVYVKTVIEKDGRIGGMKVVRSLGYGCDESAQDCIRSMPNWTPGQVAGVNVRTSVTIPVMFGGGQAN